MPNAHRFVAPRDASATDANYRTFHAFVHIKTCQLVALNGLAIKFMLIKEEKWLRSHKDPGDVRLIL